MHTYNTATSIWKETEMTPKVLNEKQASEYLNFTQRALQSWRLKGDGPLFIRISARAIRYRIEDLDAWLEDRLAKSTSDTTEAERSANEHRVVA